MSRVPIIIAAVLFVVGIGLLIYGFWLPSTANPFHDALGNGFLNEPIYAAATGYKVAGGIVAGVGVFVLLVSIALGSRRQEVRA